MKIAMIKVSRELLCNLLCLPEGAVIHGGEFSFRDYDGPLELKIEHPDLGEIHRGQCIPVVTPIFRFDSEMNKPVFVSWK